MNSTGRFGNYFLICSSTDVQGDPLGWLKPPVDLDLGCSNILPGQQVATVAAHQLLELSELSQREVLTILLGHPAPALLPCAILQGRLGELAKTVYTQFILSFDLLDEPLTMITTTTMATARMRLAWLVTASSNLA